jgi:hypothetical protein
MRTALNIDDDVLAAAKKLAAERKASVGRMLSALARQGLLQHLPVPDGDFCNGFHVLPKRGGIVTPELIERLLEPQFCHEKASWRI